MSETDEGLFEAYERFEAYAREGLDSLPPDLRAEMSNVEIVVEDEPPGGQPLLGLYQGIPLTERGFFYAGALPDRITIYRVPTLSISADVAAVRDQVQMTVVHEIAHHFGIDDDKLHALGYG
jgi:predicted Zn-dependent protease with MMP-like domain